jgi:hypothetical protein
MCPVHWSDSVEDAYQALLEEGRKADESVARDIAAIPERSFTDDLGRKWEWCGGQPGTWAWRVTAEPKELVLTESVRARLASLLADERRQVHQLADIAQLVTEMERKSYPRRPIAHWAVLLRHAVEGKDYE